MLDIKIQREVSRQYGTLPMADEKHALSNLLAKRLTLAHLPQESETTSSIEESIRECDIEIDRQFGSGTAARLETIRRARATAKILNDDFEADAVLSKVGLSTEQQRLFFDLVSNLAKERERNPADYRSRVLKSAAVVLDPRQLSVLAHTLESEAEADSIRSDAIGAAKRDFGDGSWFRSGTI